MPIMSHSTLSTTALAASATFNAPAVEVVLGTFSGARLAPFSGPVSNFDFYRVLAASDQVGTLNIQQSIDGSTWYTSVSQATVAGEATVVESIPSASFIRAQFVNGSTAQTEFLLSSMTVAR